MEASINVKIICCFTLGLSNPPGNLTVIPMTSFDNVILHISWTPPIQRGGLDEVNYKIKIECYLRYSPYYYSKTIPYDTNPCIHRLRNGINDGTCRVFVNIVRAPLYPEGLSVRVCVDTKLRCESLSSQIVPCQ